MLDLGSGSGSFETRDCPALDVRLDLLLPEAPAPGFVRGDAARLPFPDGLFDAIICNHSFEHFCDLDAVLAELGRVAKARAALYVAVPDSTSLTDRLYRWLARGGGHVNRFPHPGALISRIEAATGLGHRGTRPLLTSLSFLNRRNRKAPAPRKLILLGGGSETVLVLLNGLLRLIDRIFKTRTGLYGWALYFGHIATPVDCRTWTNVCARCGAGHSSGWLLSSGCVTKVLCLRCYRCPGCGARNFFTRDEKYGHFLP